MVIGKKIGNSDQRFMDALRRRARFVVYLIIASLVCPVAPAWSAFDPVNDDTDLFRNNPNIPSQRPNVLIVLDNSANWSSGGKFSAEKSALVNTVANLDDSFNLGLAIMGQGGNCKTANIDGIYLRFGIRQMTATNKAALTSIVNGFTDAACGSTLVGDQGSNTAGGQAMHEAYLYFSGLTARSGTAQVKRDFAGNANNTTAGSLSGNPLASAAATQYVSPIVDACQKNYIIFISNGPFDNADDAPSTTLFAGLVGSSNATTLALSPSGSQSNWADEYAKYLAETGVTAGTISAKIITYAVEVDPGTTGQGPSHTALMKSMAQQGQGKYFGVTSASAGVAISDALTSIFTEIQAVNSVFAASTLPVSVNVRGTNLNQLYIGVFRPDSADRPRWFGNLKAYQLKKDPATGLVFTVDATGVQAENSTTGFITGSAKSFWTSSTLSPTDYWNFRSASENGIGGPSDAPDGDLVEKGGAGQQLRAKYFASGVNDSLNFRPVYTCTQGTPACLPGSLLSATPFTDANTAISASDLKLSTRDVSPLSAAVVKPVTALSDTRPVVLGNLLGGIAVTSITTTTVSQNISGIDNTSAPVSISSLNNSAVNRTITSITRTSGNNKPVVVTTSAAHGLSVSTQVAVSGTTNYDATYTVEKVSSTTQVELTKSGNFAIATESTGTVTTSSTTVNATTSAAHGFGANGTTVSVTIAGATPAHFNGTKSALITSSTGLQWTGVTAPSTAATGTITATVRTTTATATTAAAHGYSVGTAVTIAGATPAAYNGAVSVATVPTSTTFTYAIANTPTPTTTASGTMTASTSGTTATVTAPTHTFTNGAVVSISGASPGAYNNDFTIFNVAGSSFDITVPAGTGTATGTITAASATATSPTVTATLTDHGFVAGDSITIGGVTTAGHNGPWTVATATANTFTYSTVTNLGSPAGSPTVRLTSSPKAYATITGHGYGAAGTSVAAFTISGAIPDGSNAGYNGTYTATVIDADTVSYVLSAAQGANTGTSVSATTPSTTALATSAAHGFTAGQTSPTVIAASEVTIAGASPSAFNGTFTVTSVPSPNTFTYTLGSPQKAATAGISGITVSSAGDTAAERTSVINWIRGEDNYEDENANTSTSDTRTTIQGDVLHSRPAVVNYNRRTTDTPNIDNDVYIFYGGNDGIFRALKGGFGSSTGDPSPGLEIWGFVAPEHFQYLRRLRLNYPAIGSTAKKPYFFDGPIGTYTLDADNDGKLSIPAAPATITPSDYTQDKVWLFLTQRRGGRFIYALDVTDPLTPRLLWRKGCPSLDASLGGACDVGFEELGQTWSEPKILKSNASTDPVLLFGAGYDANVEDVDPSTISCSSSASVIVGGTGVTCTGGTVYTRGQGRGIYALNARTGAIIWRAVGTAPSGTPSYAYKVASGMDYSIPADIAVLVGDLDSTGKPYRAYVGDTGGNMWRLDFGDASPANWSVVKLAAVGAHTTAGRRKFLNQVDVIGAPGFDAVIAGTGDREHPFDTSVSNRVYMFKDKIANGSPIYKVADQDADGNLPGGAALGDQKQAPITEGAGTGTPMFDATSNCIQDASGCTGVAPQLAASGNTASQNAAAALNAATNYGWYLTLASGEKQVGGTIAAGGGAVQFGTNQPSSTSSSSGTCTPNLGLARKYTLNFADGTAFGDLNSSSTVTTGDRSITHAGGGFLPSPVLVFVNLGGASGTGAASTSGIPVGGTVVGDQLKVGGGAGFSSDATGVVCFGANCSLAPGTQLYSRLRKFWYKELD